MGGHAKDEEAALQAAQQLGVVPIVPFRNGHRQFGKTLAMAEAVRRFQEADLVPAYLQLQRVIDEVTEQWTRSFANLQSQLREAGILPEEPPTDPRARALWLRQNRNTGPARPSAASARPPRRHQ